MTYYNAKQKIVEEQRLIDAKAFRRLTIFMALLLIGVCFMIDMLVWATLSRPYLWVIIVTIACIIIFFSIFNMIVENNHSILLAYKVSKFFIVPYILAILEFLLLSLTGFLR